MHITKIDRFVDTTEVCTKAIHSNIHILRYSQIILEAKSTAKTYH